jgi:hypothetical protein
MLVRVVTRRQAWRMIAALGAITTFNAIGGSLYGLRAQVPRGGSLPSRAASFLA